MLIFVIQFEVFRLRPNSSTFDPFSFWQHGMIGISTRFLRNFPRRIKVNALDVDQETHQLGNGKGRVSIVQLDGDFFVEMFEL